MQFITETNLPSKALSALMLAGTAAAMKSGGATTAQHGPSMRGVEAPPALGGVMFEVFDTMFLEICVLFFVILGFGMLRLDKFSLRRSARASVGLAQQLKAIRAEYQHHPAAAFELWRGISTAGHKECCPLDVLRIVMQAALESEKWVIHVQAIARYVAGFPDPLQAMPASDDKFRGLHYQNPAQGKAVVFNNLLRVAVKSGRPLDIVVSTLCEHFDAAPNEETYEILLGGYAHAGAEQRVTETKEAMLLKFKALSPKAYTAIAVGFLRSRQLGAARRAVAELLEIGLSLPLHAAVELVKAVAAAEGAAAALDEVRAAGALSAEALAAVLDEAFKRGEHTVAEAVDALLRAGSGVLHYQGYESMAKSFAMLGSPKALECFDAMASKFSVSEGTCVTLMCCCAESRLLKLAEHIVEHRQGAMTLPVYSALMKVYAAAKLYEKCCDLYPILLAAGVKPDDMMVGCLMNFAARCGRTELAEQLFAQGGPQAKVVQNYMSQIRNCRHRGGVDRALELLRQLRAQGLADQTACNSVLDVCVCAGDMDTARRLYEEEKAQSGFAIVACNTLIKGLCNCGQLSEAIALLRSEKERLNDVAFNCILNAHVRARDYPAAWAWYEEMVASGVPEDVFTLSTLVKAVKTCPDTGFVANVLRMLDSTKVDVTSDDVLLTVVLDAFVRLQDMRRLQSLVSKVKGMTAFPPVSTLNTLIKALGSLKRIDEVVELWHVITEVRALEPNEISIGCMVDAFVSNGRVDQAREFVDSWKARIPMNTVIYSTLIKGFAITRQAAKALEVFELMQAEGVDANLVTLNTLIDACARSGCMTKAADVLEIASARGLEPDRITFSSLVKGFCIAGEVQQAIAVMESSRKRGFAPDVFMFNTIMNHCASLGQSQRVDTLYAQLLAEGLTPTNFTLGVLLKRYGKDGKLDKAFETLATLPAKYGFTPGTQELTCLISACVIHKQLPRALAVYKRMRTEGPPPDAVTFERLISGVLRLGSLETAVELLREAAGLRGPLGRADRTQVLASGTVTPGGTIGRVAQLDGTVVESVVDALRAQGRTEAVAIPLLQELRAAGVHLPQRLLAGAVQHASKGFTAAPWAKRP